VFYGELYYIIYDNGLTYGTCFVGNTVANSSYGSLWGATDDPLCPVC